MARHSSPRPPSAPLFSPPASPFGAFAALAPAGGPAPIRPAWSPQPSPTARPARPTPPVASGPARPVPEAAALVHGGRGAAGLRSIGTPGSAPANAPGSEASPGSAVVPPLRRSATVPPPPPGARRNPRARRPAPAPTAGGALRSRLAVAAVAAGALATAGHSVAGLGALDAPTTETTADALALRANATAVGSGAGTSSSGLDALDAATTGVLAATAVPAVARDDRRSQVSSLSKSRKLAEAATAREAAARTPFVRPAQGRFTSGFGARWGTSHLGVDIANAIGTPIVSVADGVVTAAGPASGFGQWVKVRLDDGTETVYGHVNRYFVSEGDQVKKGEQIAEIGNRGQSTGPHLHFEVHTPGGKKINPLPWLAERGISLGAAKD